MFDIHVHIPDNSLFEALGERVTEASAKYFRAEVKKMGFREAEEDLLAQGVKRYLLLPVPSRSFDASKINKLVYNYVSASNVAVGLAAVDPARSPEEHIKEALRLGLKGLKLHPNLQFIYPNDSRLKAVYKAIDDVGGIVLVHTGTSGIGGGLRGGGGFKLDYSRPIWVDDVAAEYPNANFILAHFGWPWVSEAIAISLQKANVYLDLSGWSPKYIPQEVWSYTNTLLQDRVVAGSDYPFIKPKRWLEEFSHVPLKDEVREKVLHLNSERLLRL
ncbi:MAG: amidohydrolase family protein [Thermoprotei archaeon]